MSKDGDGKRRYDFWLIAYAILIPFKLTYQKELIWMLEYEQTMASCDNPTYAISLPYFNHF